MNNESFLIKIHGMTCVNCAKSIDKALSKKGIDSQTNFMSKNVLITDQKKIKEAKNIIKSLGFKVTQNKNTSKKIFIISLVFTLPLFLSMFLHNINLLRNPLFQLILCTPVYLIGVIRFGKSAFRSIKNKNPNMDVLIFTGASAAFIYSLLGIFYFSGVKSQYLFFETCATIITLVLLGNLIEEKSEKKVSNLIKKRLPNNQNFKIKKIINEKIENINIQDLKTNDILIINSGDIIPADGSVLEGECQVNESMITGESFPVFKTKNDTLIGGTILKDGNIKMKVLETGEKTVKNEILKMIDKSINKKPEIQKIGDTVSAYFVSFVIITSIICFITTYLFMDLEFQECIKRSIAVLVVACPCAMGLATPTAVMVGLNIALKNGIMIKGGKFIEVFTKIKNIAFDKTGTLTSGKIKIENIEGEEKEHLNTLYNLSIHSSHPISKSIVNQYKNICQKIEFDKIEEIKGVGIKGFMKNDFYFLGNPEYILKNKINKDICMTKNNKIILTFNIIDEIKKDAKNTIKYFNQKKINTHLISGDSKEKCIDVRKKTKIKNIYYRQLPEDKMKLIKICRGKNKIAMVGDGINDTPSMATADVSISFNNASNLAVDTADIVIMDNKSTNKIELTHKICRKTYVTIKQNLYWALGYNIIAIPIAFSGLLNPMWAALFMAFSDIVVIGNSLRFNNTKL